MGVIKLFGQKIYCRSLQFMNLDISIGQKYLPKNSLFQALIV